MNTENAIVGIIMGSKSDHKVMDHCRKTLDNLGIAYDVRIISAHRTPKRLDEYASQARQRGLKIIIAGAGMAAALPGAAAALTPLPVIGVPMEGKGLGGLDSLLSMVQMPGGIPVATMSLGKAGAINAALMAAAILALEDKNIAASLDKWRARQTAAVIERP